MALALIPPSMVDFLEGGEKSIEMAREVVAYAQLQNNEHRDFSGPHGEKLIFEVKEVQLLSPIPRPPKIIHTGGNFSGHVEEFHKTGWGEYQEWSRVIPTGFLEAPNTVIGHEAAIIYPKVTKQLDYEIELAVIIGKKGRYIPKEKAFEHIAGYTIFNDISARDIQALEHKNRMILLGKNLDTFAPMGPFLVLKDEIPNPNDLKMELKVNGEVRQSSNSKLMTFKVPELVEYWSQLTLEPGDVITSGTIPGVAAFMKPDPAPFFLKPGDVVEAEIEGLGVLRNTVISE